MSHNHYSSFSSSQPDPYNVARKQMRDRVIEMAIDLKSSSCFSDLKERQDKNPALTFSATWTNLDRIMPGPTLNAASSRSAGILFGMAITRKAMGEDRIWDRDVAAQATRLRSMVGKLPTLLRASRLLYLAEEGREIAEPYIPLLDRVAPYPPEVAYRPDPDNNPTANRQEFLRSLGLTVYQSTQVLKIRHAT